MTREQLVNTIYKKRSYLCVGLDTDITKIPQHLLNETDPVFEFNKSIIDATRDLCVSYKINTAFYEALGLKGWEAMEKTVRYIGEEHFRIADDGVSKIRVRGYWCGLFYAALRGAGGNSSSTSMPFATLSAGRRTIL